MPFLEKSLTFFLQIHKNFCKKIKKHEKFLMVLHFFLNFYFFSIKTVFPFAYFLSLSNMPKF